MSIFDRDITVFDFETSGLDPEKEQIIELAAIRISNGDLVSQFNTFIKYDKPLEPKITELTGITNKDLSGGMSEEIAIKIFYQFIDGAIIVAHNATFDLGFLHYAMQRVSKGKRELTNDFIDTLTIAKDRDFFPHKLTDLCERRVIELNGAHRALNDVYGCYELLKDYEYERPVDEWVNKLGFNPKYGKAKWYPAHANVFEQQAKYNN